MKQTKLSEIPIVPENYAAFEYEHIDWSKLNSEMSDVERRFINGLIRYYEPQYILEVGVYTGAGTVNILTAANNRKDVRVVSIDRAESGHFGYDIKLEIGCDVKTTLGIDSDNDKWTLITGKDPSQVMDDTEDRYEFVIIDTDHSHPVESLNFLCVLPCLKDGAIVILHDISLFVMRNLPSGDLATRILMCSLAGEKLLPDVDNSANICAIQVTAETRNCIRNIFDALMLPWGMMPTEADLASIEKFIKKYYSDELGLLFDKAIKAQKKMLLSGKQSINPLTVKFLNLVQRENSVPLTIYGAGMLTRQFLCSCPPDLPIELRIWDKNAAIINEIVGYKVTFPDFETYTSIGSIIIMIENESVANEIRVKLESLGYRVFHGIHQFITKGACK